MTALSLAERAVRTETVLAQFRARAFDWDGASCIHLARAQAVAMGHDVPRLRPIRSAIGARRALIAQGYDRVEDLLDSLFPRIGALSMLLGDLCAVPGEDDDGQGFPALFIADGAGNLMGWHAADPSRVVPVKQALGAVSAAWRL